MLLCVEIAFLFMYFELWKLERKQITGLGLATNWPMTQQKTVSQQNSCKASGTSCLGCKVAELPKSLVRRATFLNKMKDFFESLKYTWECKQQTSVAVRSGKKSCPVSMTVLLYFLQMTLTRAHNRGTTPLKLYLIKLNYLHWSCLLPFLVNSDQITDRSLRILRRGR